MSSAPPIARSTIICDGKCNPVFSSKGLRSARAVYAIKLHWLYVEEEISHADFKEHRSGIEAERLRLRTTRTVILTSGACCVRLY